ncbi:MAG: GGDEF domain-containing protein [Clostridiaceae bacterium]|nr:GGDEF domain-containing protein [Clostridiaceae bacterium]
MAESYDKRIFFKMQIMVMVTLVTDMTMWLVNGVSGTLFCIFGYVDNMIYFIAQLIVLLEWIRYAYYRIYEKYISFKTELFAVLVPLYIMGLFVVTTPLTHWCFYIDKDNLYHRGVLSFSLSVIVLAYLLWVSVAALMQRKKETLFERKRECSVISVFVLLPFVGGCIQAVVYGCSLIWPCVTLSALLLFINMENQAISIDALTRLNNRGNLDWYLYAGMERGQTVALIMLDVNSFKMFNDFYGHEMGDTVLVHISNILKNTFVDSSAFLARYGGDEFVVVLNECNEIEAKRSIEKLRKNIEAFNETHTLPFAMSASMGYGVKAVSDSADINYLMKEADKQMYREKRNFYKMGTFQEAYKD